MIHTDTQLSWLAKTCPYNTACLWNVNQCKTWLVCLCLPQTQSFSHIGQTTPLWQTKQAASQPGSNALPLAHCTFLTQLEFHSYLWGRGTVGGDDLSWQPRWNNEWLVYTNHTHIHIQIQRCTFHNLKHPHTVSLSLLSVIWLSSTHKHTCKHTHLVHLSDNV